MDWRRLSTAIVVAALIVVVILFLVQLLEVAPPAVEQLANLIAQLEGSDSLDLPAAGDIVLVLLLVVFVLAGDLLRTVANTLTRIIRWVFDALGGMSDSGLPEFKREKPPIRWIFLSLISWLLSLAIVGLARQVV